MTTRKQISENKKKRKPSNKDRTEAQDTETLRTRLPETWDPIIPDLVNLDPQYQDGFLEAIECLYATGKMFERISEPEEASNGKRSRRGSSTNK